MAEKCFLNIDESSLQGVVFNVTATDTENNHPTTVTEHHICRSYDTTPKIIKQVLGANEITDEERNNLTVNEDKTDCICESGVIVAREKVDIYLETPAGESDRQEGGQNGVNMKKVLQNNGAKPKRLSDEFFSADDGDADEEEEVAVVAASAAVTARRDDVEVNDNLSEIKNLSLSEDNNKQDVACCSKNLSSSSNNIKININLNININNNNKKSNKNKIVYHFDENSVDDEDEDDEEDDDDDDDGESADVNLISEPFISEDTSSCSDHPHHVSDVQSIDVLERQEFEQEQKLTGGIIIKSSSLISENNRLNLGLLNNFKESSSSAVSSGSSSSSSTSTGGNGGVTVCDDTQECTEDHKTNSNNSNNNITTTPTSSRYFKTNSTTTKSAVKINLSASLDCGNGEPSSSSSSHVQLSASTSKSFKSNVPAICAPQQFDVFLNTNSNDSLSNDRPSSRTQSSSHNRLNSARLRQPLRKDNASTSKAVVLNEDGSKTNEITNNIESMPSTSKPITSIFFNNCKFSDQSTSTTAATATSTNFPDVNSKEPSSSSTSTSQQDRETMEDQVLEPTHLVVGPPDDDDNWEDCEEGSEEEICTCHDYIDDEAASSEDELLPSRDVDLSSYTHLDSISDDILHDPNSCNAQTPRMHRKRKLTESRMLCGDSPTAEPVSFSSRKRLALDSASSPRSSLLSPSSLLNITSTPTSSNLGERKTPRTLIPTKENPPPELNEWLLQFQRWTHIERLVAVDRLIEHCEPTQVRHMMKVIEPQFQRDFISLLPKELALQVLSYLEPKDLLRAAQTCRSWRFLADDNLLWKEKCKEANIVMENSTDRPKRGRAGNMPPIASPFKAAYMRQHIIEMNWRSRPIRTPKVLKGHDDHVITCLQFCGNRIVSGSDDNTLKVWSAVTGKCLRTLVGHTGGVWSSQMAGSIIISGSTDRTLKVWNADTGQCVHTLYGHTSTVRCMHLHGNKVVSGSRDATLRVWDVNLGSCLHVLVGHLAAVRCVQYDGKLVVSGAYDFMVKVWNPERQECLHTLQGHTNRVYSLQFDGIHVVSGSLDTSIRVWDAETGACKHALMGHQSLTSGMELRQNILVSGNADSTVKVWDILTGQCLQTLSGPHKHQSAVTCLQFNSRFVITSSDDGTVKLWDVKTGEFIRNLVALQSGGSGGVVWRIRANDTKLICAVGSRNGTEETKLMVLDFDVEGACLKCS